MTRWRRHEEKARTSSIFRGYKVSEQKVSTSTGRRPDFFGVSKKDPSKRMVADAKYVNELTPAHVRQVRRYKGHPFYAQKGFILVKKSTRVPEDVREMARDSDIKIIRRPARVERKRSFWERLFA